MKLFIYFLCLLFILSSCDQLQKKNTEGNSLSQSIYLDNLDRVTIFNSFFHKPVVEGWCLWKPSKADSTFPVSDDSYCHTKLDTILRYNIGSTNMAVIIFGTFEFKDGQPIIFHAAAPMMSVAMAKQTIEKEWVIENFKKDFGFHGSWGGLPLMKIKKIGVNYFLEENWGFTNQGYTESWDKFWHLPSLVESIKLTGIDNSGTTDEESKLIDKQDSILDISAGNITKILILKVESRFVNGKKQDGITNRTEYQLNDSNIFKPINK
jgi:hypothetical protein